MKNIAVEVQSIDRPVVISLNDQPINRPVACDVLILAKAQDALRKCIDVESAVVTTNGDKIGLINVGV